MASIAEILRDPKKSQDEKNEAIAQLAEAYENAATPVDFEERPHWSIGAYAESYDDAEEALDEAFKAATTEPYAKDQYVVAKKALLKELKTLGDGSFSLSITGTEPADGDEGEPWSFGISHQVGF